MTKPTTLGALRTTEWAARARRTVHDELRANLICRLESGAPIFPGIVGVVCLILFLFATQVLPVNAAGVLLILLAIALFVAEVKVTSYGLLTIGGIVAMILGAMMLVDAPIPEMRIGLRTLLPSALLMAAWTSILVRLVLKSQARPAVTGQAALLGATAVAEESLAPEGWVRLMGERWRAVADGPVGKGDRVRVLRLDAQVLREEVPLHTRLRFRAR